MVIEEEDGGLIGLLTGFISWHGIWCGRPEGDERYEDIFKDLDVSHYTT